jgi:hypothetical protein
MQQQRNHEEAELNRLELTKSTQRVEDLKRNIKTAKKEIKFTNPMAETSDPMAEQMLQNPPDP